MTRGPEHQARDWLKMGMRQLKALKLEKAEECFRKAISYKDDISDVWWHLGLTLKALERVDEAEAAFKKATILDPIHGEREWKKDSKSTIILDNEVFKETGKRMKLKEINIKKQGEYSIDIVDKSDTPNIPKPIDDHSAETWYDYGCACALRGDLDSAEDALRKATEMKPEWGEAWARYSGVLMRMGRYLDGLKMMKRAKKLGFIES